MAQKKLPPGVQITSVRKPAVKPTPLQRQIAQEKLQNEAVLKRLIEDNLPDGAHVSSAGKPKPVKQPPQIHIESKMRRYADVPAFGFDILSVTINGVTAEIYRACSFADNAGIPVMILPTHNGYACMSEAEADAYKEQLKAQALKPQLVTPGHPDFKKPPILH